MSDHYFDNENNKVVTFERGRFGEIETIRENCGEEPEKETANALPRSGDPGAWTGGIQGPDASKLRNFIRKHPHWLPTKIQSFRKPKSEERPFSGCSIEEIKKEQRLIAPTINDLRRRPSRPSWANGIKGELRSFIRNHPDWPPNSIRRHKTKAGKRRFQKYTVDHIEDERRRVAEQKEWDAKEPVLINKAQQGDQDAARQLIEHHRWWICSRASKRWKSFQKRYGLQGKKANFAQLDVTSPPREAAQTHDDYVAAGVAALWGAIVGEKDASGKIVIEKWRPGVAKLETYASKFVNFAMSRVTWSRWTCGIKGASPAKSKLWEFLRTHPHWKADEIRFAVDKKGNLLGFQNYTDEEIKEEQERVRALGGREEYTEDYTDHTDGDWSPSLAYRSHATAELSSWSCFHSLNADDAVRFELGDLQALRDLPNEAFLSRQQVAELLGLTPYMLSCMADKGGGPPFIRSNNQLCSYPVKQLKNWLAEKIKEFDRAVESCGRYNLTELFVRDEVKKSRREGLQRAIDGRYRYIGNEEPIVYRHLRDKRKVNLYRYQRDEKPVPALASYWNPQNAGGGGRGFSKILRRSLNINVDHKCNLNAQMPSKIRDKDVTPEATQMDLSRWIAASRPNVQQNNMPRATTHGDFTVVVNTSTIPSSNQSL
jgi:hypothetical protein